ncbi:MAG: class I adenylate-forming enzyme family protein [Sphingobium sp.]
MSVLRELNLGGGPPMLPEIIEFHGESRPHDRAIVAHDGTRTWRELVARTNRVANGLAAAGLGHEARVGILMSNGIATVEVMIGCLRGGFIAVPINLSVTDDSVAAMLEDAGVTALVVTSDQLHRVEKSGIQVRIAVGCERLPTGWLDYDAWMEGQDEARPPVLIEPETLCVIIYSSGTTGLPKGITHNHNSRALWSSDLSFATRYHSACRTIVATGLFSNVSWLSLLCTVRQGGTVFVPHHFDVREFLEWSEREAITHVNMVPVQYQRIIEHPDFSKYDLSAYQSMMCIGSKLAPALKLKLLDLFPGAIFDAYGMTEGITTILDPEIARDRLETSGRPSVACRIAVLRDDDTVGQVGEAGEVIGRCNYAMVGYWGRPDDTREATWIDADGQRWLRSGDIGQIDADGFLTIVDRKKDLILSGGQNIYPADIESILITHPSVSECAVIGIPSDQWGETPLALVVPRAPAVDADELRVWINSRVGKQQRVSGVTFREMLPRNPNGKLLKRELRREYSS